MTWFSYTFLSSQEIFANISLLQDFSFFWILWSVIAIWAVVLLIFLILPTIIIVHKHHILQREKISKKKILTQILLQREIEDEVESEIKMDGAPKEV